MAIQHPPPGAGDSLAAHWELTEAERAVMGLRARGKRDAAIMEELDLTFPALRSRLRRFADRTGLTQLRTRRMVRHPRRMLRGGRRRVNTP